jgi:CIC family chloride channel protein
LLGLALLKVLTTSLSVSSGGSGGVFGPTVVIGGLVGGAVGYAMHYWFPSIVPHPSAFALVGMACFIGGVAHAPVSTLVMATEMTGSYELLVPLMLAEAVTFIMLRPWTLYERQVVSRKESAFHWADHYFDTLKQLHVREAFKASSNVSTVHEAAPLEAILREASTSAQDVLPVVDSNGKPKGLTSLDSLRAFMFEEGMGAIVVAHDCQCPFVSLYEDETLSTAVERFLDSGLRQLPVVDRVDPDLIVGFLSYEDVLTAYDRELQRRGMKSKPSPAVVLAQ